MALLERTAGYSFSNSFCFLIVFKTEVRMKYFFAVTQLTVFIDPNRTSFFFSRQLLGGIVRILSTRQCWVLVFQCSDGGWGVGCSLTSPPMLQPPRCRAGVPGGSPGEPQHQASFWGSCRHTQHHCSSWHLGLGIPMREHLSYPKCENVQRSSSWSGLPQMRAEHAGPRSLCHPPVPSEGAGW